MSKFPEYLEVCLSVVELNVELDRGRESAQTMVNALRGSIERYTNERVSAAMIDRSIDDAKLARLEKAVREEVELDCEERCNGYYGNKSRCDCYVGRLKAALDEKA